MAVNGNWRRAERRRWRHQQIRASLLASNPICAHCGVNRSTILDHQPPLALFPSVSAWVEAGGYYVASCKPCSDAQGGKLNRHSRHPVNSRQW